MPQEFLPLQVDFDHFSTLTRKLESYSLQDYNTEHGDDISPEELDDNLFKGENTINIQIPEISFESSLENISPNSFKSFVLEQISQSIPPRTNPVPKRPEPPKRRSSWFDSLESSPGSSSLNYQDISPDISPDQDQNISKEHIQKQNENILVKASKKKSWKTGLNAISTALKLSVFSKFKIYNEQSEKLILEKTLGKFKLLEFPQSLESVNQDESLNVEHHREHSAKSIESIESKKEILKIDYRSIYQASFNKLKIRKNCLLDQILITNFIISIVDRNSDVTLSRPKTVRKKLSRTVNKKKGDSKKARDFLIKKGVPILNSKGQVDTNQTRNTSRAPGRSKQELSPVSEEDVPLALLKK